MTDVRYEVHAVRYGERVTSYADVFHRWATYGEPDRSLPMDYYFWVLSPSDGSAPILVDTGYSADEAHRRGRTMLCSPREAMRALGVDPAAVGAVVVSHLHYDHVGNLDHFPNARFVLAACELQFWAEDAAASRPLFADHLDPRALTTIKKACADGRVTLMGDRHTVAPGVELLRVGGHTPGQLVVTVRGVQRDLLLASDAVHFYEEYDQARPTSVLTDLAGMYHAFDTIADLLDEGPKRTLIPGHDPLVSERFPPAVGPAAGFATRLA